MKKVIVFGSMNMDLCISCTKAPQAGETVQGQDFFTNPGGKGGNQATAAARLGAQTLMLGSVGQDAFGEELVHTLTQSGVDCTLVRRGKQSTGVAVITRTGSENCIIVSGGANLTMTADEVAAELDRHATSGDLFITQYECNLNTVRQSICAAKKRGLYTIFNPAPAHEIPQEVLKSTDLLVVNETECAFQTGICPENEAECREAFVKLHTLGCRNAVITLGAKGSMYLGEQGACFVPSYPVKQVVDTTGAGDTFIGGLAAELVRGTDMQTAMHFATRASAAAVSKAGAQQSIPTREELPPEKEESRI